MLKIYNTLTRNKDEFKSINEKKVGLYVCGPTVYGYPHLGHAKSYITFDIIHRYLKYLGYDVKYVQNITDVGHLVGDVDDGEDKIEKQAKIEQTDPVAIAYNYENIYFDCMDKLNIERPTISCRATGHIIEIIEAVKTLINKGYAYVTDEGNVYYRVKKFKGYGKLSGRNIEENLSGERIEIKNDKENPEDFALWKHAEKGHIMKWPSPWGEGYPGWHIECSIMSKKYLGETFDIHGGGMDNIFPHHECEIAQSEALNAKPFVNYFIHNNLVTVNGQKMGKSLGNFITLPDLFKEYEPKIIRFYVLLTQYRRPTDFEKEKIEESIKNYEKIEKTYFKIKKETKNFESVEKDEEIENIKKDLLNAMDDDFNTSLAISHIYELIKIANSELNKKDKDLNKLKNIEKVLDECAVNVLGLKFEENNESETDEKLLDYILNLRNELRQNKNFELSDQIRDDLTKLGYEVNDKKSN